MKDDGWTNARISRFVLDDRGNVIDLLNPSARMSHCHEGDQETQIDLRNRMLIVRLSEAVDNLVGLLPEVEDFAKRRHRPSRPESRPIWWALYLLVQGTYLRDLDPAVAIEKRFLGKLNREKIGLQSFTSLSLFTDDVERVLRDLYGDADGLDSIVTAVFAITEGILQFARQELWKEHQDAEHWDYLQGIGVPDECGISGSECRRGMAAAESLSLRARQVSEAQSEFGKYTVAFATQHIGEFIRLQEGPECDFVF
jgi:hypothetical protein